MKDDAAKLDALWSLECIRQLIARYGIAVDDRDVSAIADCFTEDCEFRYQDGSVQLVGRDAVLAYYQERLTAYGPTYHYPHSNLVEFIGPDHATGVVNAHAELAFPDGRTYWVALRYRDEYVRDDDVWRFRERLVQIFYFMPLEDLATGLASPLRKRMVDPHGTADIPEGLPSWRAYHQHR